MIHVLQPVPRFEALLEKKLFVPLFSHVLYLDDDLEPLQPFAVVMEEVLQLPDVLQQVSLRGPLTQGLQDKPRALWHAGYVLH